MKRFIGFVAELSRRKVFRLVGAYIAIFWLLATGFASLLPALDFPSWSLRAFVVVGIAVIPVLAFLSWKYDVVPPRLVRDSRDVEPGNPALTWAMMRHDNVAAGYVLLRWNAADQTTKEKRFFKPVSIGREPTNDVELPDQRVSRHHAVLWAEQGAWRVRDIDSTNGTFIGHTRVVGTATLPTSCDLRFHPNGPTVSVFIAKSTETMAT